MKRIMSTCVILCSFVLLSGCVNMIQNNEIKETLEKAFNTAQGNDLFEVGKQVLDTYAPSEESVYLINTYYKGTTNERDPEGIPRIYIVIKFERNKTELRTSLYKKEIGTTELIKIKDLLYKGQGSYYTLDGDIYEPLSGVKNFYENKNDIFFTSFKNQKFYKNEGNIYGLFFDSISANLSNVFSDKVDSLFLSRGPKDIVEENGGISYWNRKSDGDIKQDLEFSSTIHSVEKNMTLSADITLNVHKDFVID